MFVRSQRPGTDSPTHQADQGSAAVTKLPQTSLLSGCLPPLTKALTARSAIDDEPASHLIGFLG